MSKMKVCIVAAGLATRLQPLTNYIPKFLINIGKQTGFVEMIRYWKNYSNDFTIIIHPKYEQLVNAYFDLYKFGDDVKLTIKTIDSALGTAHTIDTALGSDYCGDEILFTWCDVIPGAALANPESIFKDYGQNATVFTIDNQKNRYKLTHDTMVKDADAQGNVFGIYYFPEYLRMASEYAEGEDICDVLARRGNLRSCEVDSIIDFGDKEKLFDVLKDADEAREFNSIDLNAQFVHKKALSAQGKPLIRREIEWYHELHSCGGFADVRTPKVYPSFDNDELVMERVDGVSIYKIFSQLNQADQAFVVCEMFDQLKKLHRNVTPVEPTQVLRDVKKEAHTKLLSRYAEIKNVINAFGTKINIVNGVKIGNPIDIIDELGSRLMKSYENVKEYSLIHGDLQMSNAMINPESLEVTFIDPRGYFGDTELYGLPDYDYSKTLYSLSGYDLFNYSQSFYIKDISETTIEFDIPKPNANLSKLATMFNPEHFLWLAVIWIGLAQYIKNNPIKSVAAHYHGLYLATKYLKGDFTL